MIHRDLEGRGGSRHYSRWPDPAVIGPQSSSRRHGQLYFSLSWQDLSSTAAAAARWSGGCVAPLELRVIRHRPRFRPLNFFDSVVRTKPEKDTFGHEPALVARTCSPAKLPCFLKFVCAPWCSDARPCHP